MGLRALGLLPLLLVLPSAESSLKHRIESRTVRGWDCINDCDPKSLKCLYEANNEDDCVPGNVIAPTYFTAQKRYEDIPICLSRCGAFDEDYEWCYVKENFDWDYCSSKKNRQIQAHGFTHGHGPCKDECATRGYGYYWCNHFFGSWDLCYKDFIDHYVQSWTIKGKQCIGHCKKHDGKDYNWCWWSKGDWDYCAHPALSIYKSPCEQNCNAHFRKKRDDMDNWNCLSRRFGVGFVLYLANYFESLVEHRLVTIPLNEPNNPVFRITVRPNSTSEEPVLPVVVRARINSTYIPGPNTRTSSAIPYTVRRNLQLMGMVRNQAENNNDEAGHLIAYMNGGPSEPYNFAPMTRRLNRGTNDLVSSGGSIWLTDEFDINQWVRGGGIVEQTVVVMYDSVLEAAARPRGFATYVQFLDGNGDFVRDCTDYVFSNNPDD